MRPGRKHGCLRKFVKKRALVAEKTGKKPVNRKSSVGAKSNAQGNLTVLRSMPESLGAEAAVLGSMIVDPRCIGDVI